MRITPPPCVDEFAAAFARIENHCPRAWPEADLRIVPDAGHSIDEPGHIHNLVTATDGFRQTGRPTTTPAG